MRVSRAALEVAVDFDERLEACETLLQRLSEQQKRSRLRSIREQSYSNDELLAMVKPPVADAVEPSTTSSEPSHVRIARLRKARG